MGVQDINIPFDVQWELIATSDDMIANHNKRFPHAMWKSSMAVFSYNLDPEKDLPDELKDKHRAITYLKVVCSITSYVPPCEECPPPPAPVTTIEDYGENQANLDAWRKKCKIINDAEHKAYACSGALVQVAIYPKQEANETYDPNKLAYFASFEPKKRELIEVGTESGESITQSKSDMNVRKGTTSTSSVDNYDVLTGVNVGGGFAGASAQVGVSGQWGTIKKSGSESVNVTNTDSSRELREGASHTTNISNLYHLLNSYHLGTNRAIFFVQPRPHTLQQKDQYTFIDGPQQIEGIQEFFLIVSRPDDMKMEDYCLDALLYTAHLDDEAAAKALNDPKTAETQWIDFSAISPPLPSNDHSVWNLKEDVDDVSTYIIQQAQNLVNFWDSKSEENPKPPDRHYPAQVDGYITPTFLRDTTLNSLIPSGDFDAEPFIEAVNPSDNSGWKIDRSRGMGGYDLWEDPNNRSGIPTSDDTSKIPPEASVDIVSLYTPNDIQNYLPDYGLRIRAQVWPSKADTMMYHGRIKAYFIRNDMATNRRAINMFVTVRGVSTCNDSPFFNIAPDKAVLIVPDIAAENHINPRNVSPWKSNIAKEETPNFTAIQNPDEQDKKILLSSPKGNSVPSGLDHQVLGAARAKMANMIGKQVGECMNSSLSCLAEKTDGMLIERYSFRHSDLFFNNVSRKLIDLELNRLSGQIEKEMVLSDLLMRHSRFVEMQDQLPSASFVKMKYNIHLMNLKKEADKTKASQDKTSSFQPTNSRKTKKDLPADKKKKGELIVLTNGAYPILTLASKQLKPASRLMLNNAGFHTALDIIGLSASELSNLLGTDEKTVRELRLQILGIDSPQTKSEKKIQRPSKKNLKNGK